jgi:hypothetical protein
VITALLFPLATVPSQANMPASGELRFDVLLDDQPIGQHVFRIKESGEQQVVQSEASFDVRVLFVPIYRYRHQNTEVWQGGCLTAIRSQTDSNGDRYELEGELAAGAFRLKTQDNLRRYDQACPMTFAYWNRDFLKQRQLINSQTGELLDVEVRPLTGDVVAIADWQIPADGYRLLNADEGIDIKVWYAKSDGRWLALSSVLENGRQMRYEPADVEQYALTSAVSSPVDREVQ